MIKVCLVLFLSLAKAQRYTRPFYLGRNTYEVNEGPKNFFPSGNILRFGLNPKLGNPNGFLNGFFDNQENQQSIFYPKFTPLNNFPEQFYQQQQQQPFGYNQKGFFNNDDKILSDSLYKRERGQQGIEGESAIKKINEDLRQKKENEEKSGFYANEEANKKLLEDSKRYDEKKLHEKEGSNENEEKNKSSHKKGHVIKHFKNSHHKDETGRDEQYYDEEHDEGGTFKYDTIKGKFGENESTQQKGNRESKELEISEKNQRGNHENSEFSGKNLGGIEEFKEEKKLTDVSEHGKGNLEKEESILGHQETEKYLLNQPLHDGFDKDT